MSFCKSCDVGCSQGLLTCDCMKWEQQHVSRATKIVLDLFNADLFKKEKEKIKAKLNLRTSHGAKE